MDYLKDGTGAHTTKMSLLLAVANKLIVPASKEVISLFQHFLPSSGVVTVEIPEYGPSPTVKADTLHS